MNRIKLFAVIMLMSLAVASSSIADGLCCGCGPLETCGWGIEVRGGVAPAIFSNREPYFLVVGDAEEGEGRVVNWFCGPKFSDVFKTPWTVAGQLNFNTSDRNQIFAEFSYTKAGGDSFSRTATIRDVEITNSFCFNSFGQFGAYLGHRYYIFSFCDSSANIYFGQKVGIAHQKKVCANIVRTQPAEPVFNINGLIYDSQTVISGGLQLGFDYCFSNCFKLLIQAEVVGTGALDNTISNINFVPGEQSAVNASNIIVGKTGTLVIFPITIGFSYNW